MKKSHLALLLGALLVATGCLKPKEEKKPSAPENLVHATELSWVEGTWRLDGKNNQGTYFKFSRGDREFLADVTQDVGIEGDKELPKGTVCRFNVEADEMEIRRKDNTVYTLRARARKADLTPSKINLKNEKACTEYLKRLEAEILAGSVWTFDFTQSKDEKTAELMLNNLTQAQTLYRKWSPGLESEDTQCINLNGEFASEADLKVGNHVFVQSRCDEYAYVTRIKNTDEPKRRIADGEFRLESEKGDLEFNGRHSLGLNSAEYVQVVRSKSTGDVTQTTTRTYEFTRWGDLIETTTIQKEGSDEETRERTLYRQAY